MSHGLKLLLMAAGAIITCIVVVVGFQLTQSGKNDTNKAKEQYTSISNEYDDVKLAAYDEVTISGSDVVNCIHTYGTLLTSDYYTFTIKVMTAQNTIDKTTGVIYDYDYVAKITNNTEVGNSTKENYINPLGKFKGKISRNKNGVIDSITFTQEK